MRPPPGILWLTLIAACVFLHALRTQPATAGGDPAMPDAVWRYDRWNVEVNPTRGIIIDISRKARVNAPPGRTVGHLKIWETFYQALTDFYAVVTDTAGGVFYTLHKENLEYGHPFSDYRLYSNDRLYTADLVAPFFPYVLEYSYRLQINNTFFWPDWVFSDSFPRQEASYTVEAPHLFRYRARAVHSGLAMDSSRTVRRDVVRWSMADAAGTASRAGSPPYPVLYIAPLDFAVARRRGSAESWQSLGRWYGDLTEGSRKVTAQQVADIKSWVTEETDPRNIAARLKDLVSQNWRYVAIEVGLGGWRPHDAASVFDSRYGDCKDLTFLWLAMLDVFGIPAYPALVRARNPQPIDADFPKDWFDHVIGCAIIGADTIWADLTAPGYSAGRLPYQVEDRWALVVGPEGGTLCHTPSSSAADNRLVRALVGRVGEDGTMSFELRATVTGHKLGLFGSGPEANNHSRKVAEVLGVLPGRLKLDTARFEFSASDMIAHVEAAGSIAEWAEATSRRIIFPLEFAGWAAPQPLNDLGNDRALGLRPYPCEEVDSLAVTLPAGYVAEFAPTAMEAGGEDGKIAVSAQLAGRTLTFFRRFESTATRADRAAGLQTGQLRQTMAALRKTNAVFVRTDMPVPTGSGGSTPRW